MKLIITFYFLIFIQSSLTTKAFSEDPYREGVEAVVLNQVDINELKAYAENTKSILERALYEAKEKPSNEALLIYEKAIHEAVFQSFVKKKHFELLMRFILNQARDLVSGTPGKSGEESSSRKEGVLKRTSKKDLSLVIYEESFRLALNFYSDDKETLSSMEETLFSNSDSDSVITLIPYNKMAFERLRISQQWVGGVFEEDLKFEFLMRILEHWLLTVSQKTNLQKTKMGALILYVQDVLGRVKLQSSTGAKVRLLKGAVRWVLKQSFFQDFVTPNNNYYYTKPQLGCWKEWFIEVIGYSNGRLRLQCYKKSYLKTQDSYLTKPQLGCWKEWFIEGVISYSNGRLRLQCYNKKSYLKTQDSYFTDPKFGCWKGFVKRRTTNYGLQCYKKSYLKTKDYYYTDPKFGCWKGFVKGRTGTYGLKCYKKSYLKTKGSYFTEPKFGCWKRFVKGRYGIFGLPCYKKSGSSRESVGEK